MNPLKKNFFFQENKVARKTKSQREKTKSGYNTKIQIHTKSREKKGGRREGRGGAGIKMGELPSPEKIAMNIRIAGGTTNTICISPALDAVRSSQISHFDPFLFSGSSPIIFFFFFWEKLFPLSVFLFGPLLNQLNQRKQIPSFE